MNDDNAVGIFIGLESVSNEYVAQLIAPYRPDFSIEIGTLLLIQNTSDRIVARVMEYVPRGEFMSAMGEKWLNEMASQGAIDAIGQDIKRSKVSYKVRIKVLGYIGDGVFHPGLRRIPQITSKVTLPDGAEFARIIESAMAEQSSGVLIGHHALDGGVPIMFDQRNLNAKRTFIFARAGYGKSNLMKVICKEWRKENGGLLVFDQDGEYAVTDAKGRPGVMDARDAILATNQAMDPDLPNVYGNLRLNLADLPHTMIVPLLVDPSKHQTVFFAKLMAMDRDRWPELVAMLKKDGWGADYNRVHDIVLGRQGAGEGYRDASEVDVKPILNNLVPSIRRIHDEGSRLIHIIEMALRAGHVTILDISRIDATAARFISSIIVKRIFDENQTNFIKHGGKSLIKATFVLEEAHNVLNSRGDAPSAFVDLAKEGRKYGLGGIFITQQPGSIPPEIVSQGDNFFVFHLLSKTDLRALSDSNAHYSGDIITQILSEPIRGKSYMWTSHQPFVIPIVVADFGKQAAPHSSIERQKSSRILDGIKQKMADEANNPIVESIYEKLQDVEREMKGDDLYQRTKRLFNILSTSERDYLGKKNCLWSQGDVKPYSVTFECYNKLKRDGVI